MTSKAGKAAKAAAAKAASAKKAKKAAKKAKKAKAAKAAADEDSDSESDEDEPPLPGGARMLKPTALQVPLSSAFTQQPFQRTLVALGAEATPGSVRMAYATGRPKPTQREQALDEPLGPLGHADESAASSFAARKMLAAALFSDTTADFQSAVAKIGCCVATLHGLLEELFSVGRG